MFRLATLLYGMIATVLAGICVIAALTAGYVTLVPILIAAGVGAAVAIPVSFLAARQIVNLK